MLRCRIFSKQLATFVSSNMLLLSQTLHLEFYH